MKKITHPSLKKQLPEISQMLGKGVVAKTGIAHQAPFPQSQQDNKPQVVVRKLDNFADKLKA